MAVTITLDYRRKHNMASTCHSQFGRSIERILEEANLSGELILTNRKLKDFPKTGTKYNLADTVFADLSRNRFCELPEELTTFAFLETLVLYHNTIRSIPQSVKHLALLTYLDLRSNQLSTLSKEVCSMPLQVLLVSNNRLVSLPDELGCMDRLTDFDVSYNQLTSIPSRVGELRSLKSFCLHNNQILCLPRELACLSLISLDVSNNRISNLPLEVRQMTTLVELKLGNNPLTSPPASLCVRGLVHIFKFLEIQAAKDEKGGRVGGNYDGYTTLRRGPKQNVGNIFETCKSQKSQIDSCYSTCVIIDKRRSNNSPNILSSAENNLVLDEKALKDSPAFTSIDQTDEKLKTEQNSPSKDSSSQENRLNDNEIICSQAFAASSASTPEEDMMFIDKNRTHLGNIQTYREYKAALKQQRNIDISNVYRAKNNKQRCNKKEENETFFYNDEDLRSKEENINKINNHLDKKITEVQLFGVPKKAVQNIIPSRNNELTSNLYQEPMTKEQSHLSSGYVKPNSPRLGVGCGEFELINNTTGACGVGRNKFLPEMLSKHQRVISQNNSNRSTWNQDGRSEMLSFTMRREFDRQKEETELIIQLRNLIQLRLKTILPEDLASALTDGVILCHLANHVRPRSVASIHVPSPGISKLTMARCRRNVDNFLEACRKIGVDENLMCCAADILEGKGVVQVAITVFELFRLHRGNHDGNIDSPTRLIVNSIPPASIA